MNINKLLYITMVVTFVATSCNDEPPKKDNIVQVKAQTVTEKPFRFPRRVSGILSTSDEFNLSFKTGGILQTIFVKNGQKVKEGRVLATLELSEIEANVSQARASVDKTERDYQRTKNLFDDSVATKEQLQNAKTALEVAKSQLKIATFNLQHSKIIAPSNGTVLNILKEENELVSPGYPVILFGSTEGNWIMKVNVTDKDLVEIKESDSAQVFFDAYPAEPFPGQITIIGKGADPYTNTYPVEVSLDAKGKHLASGFIGHVDLFPSKAITLPVIPYDALLEGDELSGIVIVLKNDTAHEKRQIQIKRLLDEGIVVASGLKKNERIITEGLQYLDDNTKIKVVEQNK